MAQPSKSYDHYQDRIIVKLPRAVEQMRLDIALYRADVGRVLEILPPLGKRRYYNFIVQTRLKQETWNTNNRLLLFDDLTLEQRNFLIGSGKLGNLLQPTN